MPVDIPPQRTRRAAEPLGPHPKIAVVGCEALCSEGATAFLRTSNRVRLLDPDRIAEADVVLVLAYQVTDEVLTHMADLQALIGPARASFVLVGDNVADHQLLRAVSSGLVGYLPRATATFARILEAVLTCARGGADLPASAARAILDEVRSLHDNVLRPLNLTASGLSVRELDILRLLAEGHELAEIAAKLHYSERTIKSTIHQVLERLSLRNRVHAVAYACRRGLL